MSELRARILSNMHFPAVEGFPVRTFGHYLPEGQGIQGWRADQERRSLSEILPLIPAAEKPDILVISSPEYLPIPVDVASFPGLKILLITDWNVCLRFLPDLCPLFDFCFTDWPGYRLLKRAGIANIRHQPIFGHDPDRFRVTGLPRNLDVSFCGNLNSGMHGERNRLLARLARWSQGNLGGTGGPARPVHLRMAFDEAYVEVLNRSRLVFNYSIRGEANMRLFETMAAGAVPLVEAGNEEVAILFQEGKHYFRYAPDRLEERLDSLLADPARLEAVAAEARTAVGRHTKALQLQALFESACREAPAVPAEQKILAGRKSLIKLRVMGAGYTMTEALGEIQSSSAESPGLEFETVPATLLSLLTENGRDSLAAAERILERYLEGETLPQPLRAFLGMKLALLRGQWTETLELADRCLRILDALAPASETVRPLYGFFHPPLNLGKGFNIDLNAAFRAELAGGKRRGYLELLLAHCRADKAKAFLSLGLFRESAAELEGVHLANFASLDPYGPLLDALFKLGDIEGARTVARAWFTLKPLDTVVWDKVFEAYAMIGDKSLIVGFLEEITLLAEAFLSREQSELIGQLLARERG